MVQLLSKIFTTFLANKLLAVTLVVTITSTAVLADPEMREEYYESSIFQSVAETIEEVIDYVWDMLPEPVQQFLQQLFGKYFPNAANLNENLLAFNPSEFEVLVCGRCHQSTVEKQGLPNVHVPFAAGRCSDCHLPHDPETFEAKLLIPKKELCNSCHNFIEYKNKPHQHVPFKENRCMDCHDPHASENMKQLVLPPQVLCRTCHNFDKGQYFENKHPPYQVGDCIVCHHPHAADNFKNTREALPDLCFRCHRKIAHQQQKAKVLHPPFAASKCTACHNPHQTNTYKLTQKPIPNLCFQCHNPERIMGGFSHPMFNVISPFDGKIVTCLSCHNPHGNENERMWRRPKQFLCLGCHKNKADQPIPQDKLEEHLDYDE